MSDSGERPTFWIVLSVVLLLVAVGLGAWAISAQRKADDAQEQLAAQQRAAESAQQKSSAADKARGALDDALTRAQDEIGKLQDAGSTVKACLQRAIDTIQGALSGSNIASAISRLQALVGDCRDAAT